MITKIKILNLLSIIDKTALQHLKQWSKVNVIKSRQIKSDDTRQRQVLFEEEHCAGQAAIRKTFYLFLILSKFPPKKVFSFYFKFQFVPIFFYPGRWLTQEPINTLAKEAANVCEKYDLPTQVKMCAYDKVESITLIKKGLGRNVATL